MDIRIQPIPIEQKPVLMQMMELYSYDFSEFSGDELSDYGYYGYSHIDDYWNEDGRYAYFIRVNGYLAGLAMIRSCSEYNDLKNPHNIAEFFVLKKYRQKGIGKEAAFRIFDLFPGSWEVSVWSANHPAQKFWNSVIGAYTGGNFGTFIAADGDIVGFTFRNT